MANKYWVGSVSGTTPASGNWSSSTGWRTTSGGLVVTTPPGSADIAIFDNNSFLGAAITVTVDSAITINGINASGITTGANGITLASSGSGAIQLNTGSVLTLPASRFTWTCTGGLSLGTSATSTWTTNGVAISSPITLSSTNAALTISGDVNCTSALNFNGGTINFASYQIFCSSLVVNSSVATTFNITTAGAGITVTGNSGTIVNWATNSSRIFYSAIKFTLTLTASGTATGRSIAFTGTGYQVSTSIIPALKFTNGSDTITIIVAGVGTLFNCAGIDTTGCTSSLTFNFLPNTFYVYGDVILTPSFFYNGFGFVGASTTSKKLTLNISTASTSPTFVFTQDAVYVQQGIIDNNIDMIGSFTGFTTGSFTFNNTGRISGKYTPNNRTYFVGDIVFNQENIELYNAYDFTSCTSVSVTQTSAFSTTFTLSSSSYSVPTTFTQASGVGNQIFFKNFTQTGGSLTLNSSSISVTSSTSFTINSGVTFDAGTSSITLLGNSSLVASTSNFNNVIVSGSSVSIAAAKIQNLSNTVQPATTTFASDVVFDTFNLNGTSGNLITVTSDTTTQRTLTKKNAWTLDHSTDSGNNTGITFLSSGTGNNSYLNVSYINGIVSGAPTATGNFFLLF